MLTPSLLIEIVDPPKLDKVLAYLLPTLIDLFGEKKVRMHVGTALIVHVFPAFKLLPYL